MSHPWIVASRVVPSYLNDLYGKDKLEQVLAAIAAGATTEAVNESGILERSQLSSLLSSLVAEKIISSQTDDIGGKAPSILLVTDSSADLPAELIRERGIVVMPLTVTVDGKSYRDGVDISSQDFYRLLSASSTFPVTAPPTKEDFHRVFAENIGEHDILGIFLSARMSKTFEIAGMAVRTNFNTYLHQRRAYPHLERRFHIELIDSRQVSMGAALLVLEASDKIREGWPLARIKAHIESLSGAVQVCFMVDNLDYLARGGRIGRGAALLGNFFGLKPILGMNGGGVDAKTRTIGGRWGQRKLVEYMREDLAGTGGKIRIGVCHADAPKKAASVQAMLSEVFPGQGQVTSFFGPTVGSHLGPGAVGVAWMALPR